MRTCIQRGPVDEEVSVLHFEPFSIPSVERGISFPHEPLFVLHVNRIFGRKRTQQLLPCIQPKIKEQKTLRELGYCFFSLSKFGSCRSISAPGENDICLVFGNAFSSLCCSTEKRILPSFASFMKFGDMRGRKRRWEETKSPGSNTVKKDEEGVGRDEGKKNRCPRFQ